MAAELPRPGVEVVQVFRTVSPTIVTPTLVPNVVGVAKQIVEVFETNDAGGQQLNSEANVDLPAFFLTEDGPFASLNNQILSLIINNSPAVDIEFDDPLGSNLSAESVVAQIVAAFAEAGVTAATAEVVGDAVLIRTVGSGEFQTILIDSGTSPAVASAFGIGIGRFSQGTSAYSQYGLSIPYASLPDPRGNMDELVVDDASIRVFLASGGGTNLREALRTEAFLRKSADDAAVQIVGNVDLTTLTYANDGSGDLDDETLRLAVNGNVWDIDFGTGASSPQNVQEVLDKINAQAAGVVATINGSDQLVLTTVLEGPEASLVVVSGTTNNVDSALVDLGLAVAGGYPVPPVIGAPGTPATVTGVVNVTLLGYPPPPAGSSFSIQINGGSTVSATVTASDPFDLIEQLNDVLIPAGAVVYIDVATGFLIFKTLKAGGDTKLVIPASQISVVTGTTSLTGASGSSAVVSIDDGNGDIFTSLLEFSGQNFTSAAAAAVVTGTEDVSALTYPGDVEGLTLVVSDGFHPVQTVTFSDQVVDTATLLAEINAVLSTANGGLITASLAGNNLRLTHDKSGVQSYIELLSSSTALTVLGLTDEVTRGTSGPPRPGDSLWIDGVEFATISEVAPGGDVDVLKINKQIAISNNVGRYFYIVAKGLPSTLPGRPDPELTVVNGKVTVKHELLRDTTGAPLTPLNVKTPVYVSYEAIRQDVSPLASNPGLLRIDSTTDLEDVLSPISTRNPLALGLFFALVNAPGVQVTGLGVDATSADAPFGTVEAFTRAAEFLESFEVYAIAPLTHDKSVGELFSTHVSFMSEPEQKGERIVLFNSEEPTNKLDTLVASGAKGNSVGSAGTQFDTGVANLSAMLLNAGVNPVGTIPVSAGVYLDIASDSKRYSVQSISAGVVTIRTAFGSGENDDGYYSTTDLNDPPLPILLIDETFAIRIRGAALVKPDGSPDKQLIAETYQGLSQSFGNRRFWHTMPDRCAATIEGVEQVIEGFYMNAAIAGMIGQQPPQQSFTNFPMSGFTRVLGSNDRFSEKQLNVVAAGGTYIIVQDAQGAPLISRMALTSDMTSVETRTDSITKVVDFTAKFLRKGLRNFIGRFNITQGFLDSLGAVIQGLGGFLVENGILIGFNLNNIVQDEDQPDTVLVDVTLDVPYPCNYLRLTLVI